MSSRSGCGLLRLLGLLDICLCVCIYRAIPSGCVAQESSCAAHPSETHMCQECDETHTEMRPAETSYNDITTT